MTQKPLSRYNRKLVNEAAGFGSIPFYKLRQSPEIFHLFERTMIADGPTISTLRYKLNAKGKLSQRLGSHVP